MTVHSVWVSPRVMASLKNPIGYFPSLLGRAALTTPPISVGQIARDQKPAAVATPATVTKKPLPGNWGLLKADEQMRPQAIGPDVLRFDDRDDHADPLFLLLDIDREDVGDAALRLRKPACVVVEQEIGRQGLAAAGLLAQVVVSKFGDHLPGYRLEDIFSRHGVEIRRSTIYDWLSGVADLCQPLYQLALLINHLVSTYNFTSFYSKYHIT